MNTYIYIPLWSTRNILIKGISFLFTCYWAVYSYPNYHHVWYYWPFFVLVIVLLGFNLLNGITIVRLEETDITVFRLFSQITYHFVDLEYGQKQQLGVGRYRLTYWPILISGQITTKDGTFKPHHQLYLSGSIALNLFKKICAKHRPDLLQK